MGGCYCGSSVWWQVMITIAHQMLLLG
jgi:hypothetical protein